MLTCWLECLRGETSRSEVSYEDDWCDISSLSLSHRLPQFFPGPQEQQFDSRIKPPSSPSARRNDRTMACTILGHTGTLEAQLDFVKLEQNVWSLKSTEVISREGLTVCKFQTVLSEYKESIINCGLFFL